METIFGILVLFALFGGLLGLLFLARREAKKREGVPPPTISPSGEQLPNVETAPKPPVQPLLNLVVGTLFCLCGTAMTGVWGSLMDDSQTDYWLMLLFFSFSCCTLIAFFKMFWRLMKTVFRLGADRTTRAVGSESQHLYTCEGRIGRGEYFGRMGYVIGVYAILLRLIVAKGSLASHPLVVIFLLISFAAGIAVVARTWILRLHDMNWSSLWWLLFVVPFVDIVMGVVLLLWPSTNGENRFGKLDVAAPPLFF